VDVENKHLPDKLTPKEHLEVLNGDILITCAGPRARCGVACLVKSTRPKLLISGKMYQLRCDSEVIVHEFLECFLREPGTQKAIDKMKTGINDSGLNLTHGRFKNLEIPLPPLNEQKRIVAKIEELFSEIDAGVASLRQARSQLDVYRQALLKKAFTGELTADWRKQHPDQIEPAEKLLERIRQEREARYQQQLDDWKSDVQAWEAGGNKGKKPGKPKKPRSLKLKDAVGEGVYPASWVPLSVSDVGRIETGTTPPTKEPSYYGGYVPFFKPTDLDQGENVRSAREHLTNIGALHARILPAGTTLVTCIGATIGKTGLARVDCATNQQINTISPEFGFDEEFVYYQCIAPAFNERVKGDASSTTLPILNKSKFSMLPVVVCSLPEQKEIVRRLETQFEAIEQNEREIDAALQRAEALRQSILKKAFSGQLVPQDPDDEPASVLLERIRDERKAVVTKDTKKKAPKKRSEQ
jgi:type I restriction enzyme S subunit